MMFPWFDKNATKECRCYCCNPGPLHTTHLQSEGRKKEPLSSFLPPLLNKHMHVHAHMHTHKHTPVWFISACAINALNANLYIVLPVSMKMFSSVFQFIFYTFLKVLVFVFFFFFGVTVDWFEQPRPMCAYRFSARQPNSSNYQHKEAYSRTHT